MTTFLIIALSITAPIAIFAIVVVACILYNLSKNGIF